MAIKTPTRVSSGGYLDLRELVANEPHGVLALFRIVEFLPGEPSGYNDPNTRRARNTFPVVADVMICSGPRAGEVCLREEIKYAPSNALRGIGVGASEGGTLPVNEPGDELPYIVSMIEKKGAQPFVGLDPAEGGALEVILSVHADGAGWAGTVAESQAAPAAQVPAAVAPVTPITQVTGPALSGLADKVAGAAPAVRPWQRAV